MQHASGATRTECIAHPGRPLSDNARVAIAEMVERRRRGEPISYITGHREFWSLDLAVSPATLIPRPETELLVERALTHIAADTRALADLGTGSGAIALALAHECSHLQIVATDASQEALAVAQANAKRLSLTNVQFVLGDWFVPLAGKRFDIVVSNPPYIRTNDPHLNQGDLRFEPQRALASGADGLDAIRHLISEAPDYLNTHGWLLLEHGAEQGASVRKLFRANGYVDVASFRDLADHERVTEGRRNIP